MDSQHISYSDDSILSSDDNSLTDESISPPISKSPQEDYITNTFIEVEDEYVMVPSTKQLNQKRKSLMKHLTDQKTKPLKIKFVISEATQNSITKISNRILAPVLNKMGMLPEYGLFHTSLIVGPWKVCCLKSNLLI